MWEEKKKEPPNVTKKLLHVMLELYNVRIEPLNVRKNKGTNKCNKRTVTVMLELHNLMMESSNVMFW